MFIGLAYLLMILASLLTASGHVSPLWLVGLYFLEVVGEMCLSPVDFSTVTKLALVKLLGIMMGVWFLAAAFGNKLAGYLGGFFVADNPQVLVRLYGGIASACSSPWRCWRFSPRRFAGSWGKRSSPS
ncbi:MAG: hypothetical protein H0X04_09260 [Chthoniobacterales bacterium]|nr:hypothetical protein [Chthoniobacterales bacterium]